MNEETDTAFSVPEYGELDIALTLAEVPATPAEAHGVICGVICGTPLGGDNTAWLPVLLANSTGADDENARDLTTLLTVLHTQSLNQLLEGNMRFHPLLPDDSESLGRRLEAVADWCSGFLTGLVAAGAGEISRLPADAAEVARDFMRISEVSLDEEPGEDGEQDLMQVEEYIRAGVQIFYDELQRNRPSAGGSHATH